MITTDTFTDFGRRLAATQGCPYVVVAETPNPIRQLDAVSLRARAEAMIDTIIAGLTQPREVIQERNLEIAARRLRPAGVVRAALPV